LGANGHGYQHGGAQISAILLLILIRVRIPQEFVHPLAMTPISGARQVLSWDGPQVDKSTGHKWT
jgi:hypothetical protein